MNLPPQKILIIHNPRAGQRAQGRLQAVLDILRRNGLEISLQETTSGDHARKSAAEQATDFDMIVAAGGDGTINDVMNGLYPLQTPLALIPLGTANVLAKEIGLSMKPALIARTIMEGEILPCWPGMVGTRYFSLMLSTGPDAHIVRSVSLPLKKIVGKWAYVFAFLKYLLSPPDITYRVTIDGALHEASAVIVTKGRYYASRYLCAPEAHLGTRKFQVILMEKSGRSSLLRYAVALTSSRIFKLKDVKILPAENVLIESDDNSPVQIDGDVAGMIPVKIGLAHSSLNLVVPKS